jgi:putative membrane protein
MQFLRTAFWVILAVAIALFCKANNRPMEIKIWGDIVWDTRIWFPMLIAFLLGAIPFWIVARATRWRLQRRLESTERALAAATMAAAPPPPPVTSTTALLPDEAPAPTITGPA